MFCPPEAPEKREEYSETLRGGLSGDFTSALPKPSQPYIIVVIDGILGNLVNV